jgi:hypothetical protein
MRISDAVRNALATAFATAVDAGTGDSKLQLYSGTRPGSIGGTPSGDLLAELTLPGPAFGSPSAGTITADTIPPTVGTSAAGAGGTPVGWFRVLDGDGTVVEDSASVGTSGTELVLNQTSVYEGEDVEVTAWTVTMPAGT